MLPPPMPACSSPVVAAVLAVFLAAAGSTAQQREAVPPLVVRETVLAPRAAVWAAWTTSAGLMTFLAPRARIELRSGGPFEAWFDPAAEPGSRGSEGCEVLAWIDGEMLTFSWSAPPSLGHLRARRGFVVVRLTDRDDGKSTAVELVHGGFASDEGGAKVRAYFATAWPFVLANLGKSFREGPLWTATEAADAPPGTTWVVLLSPVRKETAMNPTDEEAAILGQHAEHVRTLADRAAVVIAGPCLGETFAPRGESARALDVQEPLGVVVLRARDAEEARATMEADPAVRAGIFAARILPLRVFVER
ncbi:MAG: SRPBCC domain-containing protein [Planctomycetes bacterium]|nr:SRPBCC domain-containing protein [Planctomycetota bacterium]